MGKLPDHGFGLLLLLPALVLVSLMVLYPLARNVHLSFYEKDLHSGLESRFAGWYNYQRLGHDSRFFTSFFNTVFFTGVSVSIELLLGLGFALVLNASFPARGAIRAMALIPWALPTAVMAMAWTWIYNDVYGVLNDVLLRLGIIDEGVAWLGTPSAARWAVIFADVWKTTPFVSIILLAGLQSIPADLCEAIRIDGAKAVQGFRLVTLPLLLPSMVVALLFRTVHAFGIFDLIYVLTGGGPGGATETVSVYVYYNLFRYLDFGYAAALVVATFLVLLLVAILTYLPMLKREVELG
ncbi:MAG: sugar ABC transporter permease [Acidobacteria bacterium]|nr:sugar ABC transporter permease [Acidobacteriota bacterium]